MCHATPQKADVACQPEIKLMWNLTCRAPMFLPSPWSRDGSGGQRGGSEGLIMVSFKLRARRAIGAATNEGRTESMAARLAAGVQVHFLMGSWNLPNSCDSIIEALQCCFNNMELGGRGVSGVDFSGCLGLACEGKEDMTKDTGIKRGTCTYVDGDVLPGVAVTDSRG